MDSATLDTIVVPGVFEPVMPVVEYDSPKIEEAYVEEPKVQETAPEEPKQEQKKKGFWSWFKRGTRKITTPMTLEGMIAKVSDDKVIAEHLDDARVKQKVETVVKEKFAKYEDILRKKLPLAAQTAGTGATFGADIVQLLSGGAASYFKLYAVGARAALEAPTMIKTAYREGLYHGIKDTAWFAAKKAASFFLPFIGPLIDAGSAKNYARDAVVREARKELRRYLKKDYIAEKEAVVKEAKEWEEKQQPAVPANRILNREKVPVAANRIAEAPANYGSLYAKLMNPTGHWLN